MTDQSPPSETKPSARQLAQRLNRMRAGAAPKIEQKETVRPKKTPKISARATRDWGSTDAPGAYNSTFAAQMPALNVTKGDVARFIFLPQIGNSLKSVGFSLAVIMQTFAVILIAARLLPADHPARTLEGARRYHLLNLLGEARRNLKFTRAALPQWAIFASVCGFIISFASVLMLMLAKFGFGVAMAYAQGAPNEGTGTGANAITGSMLSGTDDLGTNIINAIFNLNNTSTVMPGINLMLQMYSYTMLVFAGVILLWIVVSTVADTARTGVPFGKHFNPVWAPIRIIVAIGLLVPLGSGLNSGQHIVLSLTKWGSGQATHIWQAFSDKINAGQGAVSSGGKTATKATYDNIVMQELLSQVAEELSVRAGLVGGDDYPTSERSETRGAQTADGKSLAGATLRRRGGVAGVYDAGSVDHVFTNRQSQHFANGVVPSPSEIPNGSNATTPSEVTEGAYADQYKGARTLRSMLQTSYTGLVDDIVTRVAPYDANGNPYSDTNPRTYHYAGGNGNSTSSDWTADLHKLQDTYWNARLNDVSSRSSQYDQKLVDQIKREMSNAGWAAAPIWINAIARENAAFISAIGAFPVYTPPSMSGSDEVSEQYRQALQIVYWQDPQGLAAALAQTDNSPETSQLAAIFLNNGQPLENPLEHLTTIGRYAMNTAVYVKTHIAVKADSTQLAAGIITSLNKSNMKKYAPDYDNSINIKLLENAKSDAAKDEQKKAMFMPLAIFGFLLGYMLPLMPFFRFVLGVLGWLLLVFEALLAMPLFALAHLKTDGDGFMSQMAQSGYIMILGLIIRPILMIIGLVVGLICFNAIAQLTNVLFTYAISSTATGVAGAGSVDHDETSLIINMMLYASFMITLANSSFKAIDIIPNHVMGWLGSRMDSRVEDSAMVQQTAMQGLYAGGGALGMAMGGGAPAAGGFNPGVGNTTTQDGNKGTNDQTGSTGNKKSVF